METRMTFHVLGQSLAELEREHILETLAQCRGNRTHAAKILKISVRSLRMKLQNYAQTGAEVPAPEKGETTTTGAALPDFFVG
jgi:DNA-binding NtrC family response regulator